MDSAPVISPSSDEKFWTKLRDRVDTILEDTNSSPLPCRQKLLREDPLLLIRGLDSVASSLSQLTNSLNAAQKSVRDLAKPPQRERKRTHDGNACPEAKRHRGSETQQDINGVSGSDELVGDKSFENRAAVSDEVQGEKTEVTQSGNMKKAKNLAVSMASKAALLAREIKTVKSELQFMQERCAILEEENRRLREGMEKGERQEEDDLMRLQLEALLAEKSRLANENANLTRENQCLHQLVEYHQLTSQDLASSYEFDIQGTCLDFSSPLEKIDSDSEGENGSEGEP